LSSDTYDIIIKVGLISLGAFFVLTMLGLILWNKFEYMPHKKERALKAVTVCCGIMIALGIGSLVLLQSYYNNSRYAGLKQYYGDRLSQQSIAQVQYDYNSTVERARVALYDIDDEKFFYTNADKPEDVRYVVLVEFEKTSVGKYSDGAHAYRYDCSFKVADVENWKIIITGSISGKEPPEVKSNGGDRVGPKPEAEEIIDEFMK
jgi:glucan phosphoethanolaminetransferase (alkaline phosphatase superfamily)